MIQPVLPIDGTCVLLVLIVILVTTACLAFPDRCIGTERRTDLNGPRGLPLFGNLFQLFPHRTHMLQHLSRMEQQYGEIFTFTMPGWGRNIIVNRPEWLEHIRKRDTIVYGKGPATLKIFHEFPGAASPFGTEGSQWRKCRKVMQPVFLTKMFDDQVSRAMNEIMPVAVQLLSSASDQSIEFDFNSFCGRLALVIFCKMALTLETTILTSDPSCLTTPDKIMDAIMTLNRISSGRLYNPFWPITEKLDGKREKFNSARSDIFQIINQIIGERKARPLEITDNRERDFLATLLADPNAKDDKLLQDTLVTLLFAGRDNTQNVLGWSLYELNRRPEWIDKMREESRMCNGDGSVVRYSDISKFPIHLAVFYETLRLWPGVPKNARLATKDDILPAIPEDGYPPIRIAKGDYVLWSDYSMMRNVKVWGPDANTFNPGRHLVDGKFVKPPQPRFHAFGAGPRICPGAQLAAYEFVAIWTAILPSFELFPSCSEDRHPVDAFTMSMDGPFMIRVKAL